MDPAKLFEEHGVLHIKDVVGKELRNFLTNVLLRAKVTGYGEEKDPQVENAWVVRHDIVFETLLERLWPEVELLVGKELLPTYAYARLYTNGNELVVHRDRPACEISLTIQLGRSHHYAWPIYVEGRRFDLAEGDAVVYKGHELLHWRSVCDGPEDYYSGQVFIHFVDANGQFSDEQYDGKCREVTPGMFVKNRSFLMENK